MRDETLERLMTEAVEGIDPRPEDSLRRVIGRGSRRRAVRWTAIGSALAAFVLVVAGAGLWVVDHQGEPAAPGISNERLHPVVADRFPVGPRGQSTALTTGGGYLWVAAYGLEGDSSEGVLAIDPNNGKVVATVTAPVPSWETGGGGLTYAFGSIWVGGYSRGEPVVTRIDPATFEVQEQISLGDGGVTRGTVADLDAASASMWVVTQGGMKDYAGVTRINGTTNEVTGSIELPPLEDARRIVATDEVVIAQGWDWRDNSPQNIYNAIDPNSMELRGTFDSGVHAGPAAGIMEHQGAIWGLYSEGPDRQGIARLDPMTAEPVADRTLFAPNHAPRSFVISGDGGIWFGAYPGGSGGSGDNLSFLDTETHAIRTFGKGGGTPTMLGGDLWFLGWDGVLTRYDLVPDAEHPWNDEGGITSATVPVGWKVGSKLLAPDTADSREIATFGTVPVRFHTGAMCSEFLMRGEVSMGRRDAIVQLRETGLSSDGPGEGTVVNTNTRPEPFVLDEPVVGGEHPACMSLGSGASMWIDSFEQNGRQISVFVAMGEEAAGNRALRSEVEALLNSLVIEPRPAEATATAAPNPCSLMDQVTAEDMLSIRIGDVRQVEPDEWHKAPEPWPAGHIGCRYESDGRLGEVIVALRQVSREEFERVFLNHPGNDHIVRDLGDLATWSGCGGVHAWQDGVLVQVGVQYSDCDIRDPLIELTRVALERAMDLVPPG